MEFDGIAIDVSTCIWTGYDKDGFPIAQCDPIGEDPAVAPYQLHHQFGFASLPRDPELDADGNAIAGKGCVMFHGVAGDDTHAWLGADPRYTELLPKLKKGGSMQYCVPGSFAIFDGDDGSYTMYVPIPNGDDPPEKAHVVSVGLDGTDKPYVGIEHADGMALTMYEKSATLKNASGNAYVEVNDSGIVLNGNVKHNGALVLGNVAAAGALVTHTGLQAILTELVANLLVAINTKSGPAAVISPLTTIAAAATTMLKAT